VVELTFLRSDSECETLILPREEDILSSPTPTVDYFSHIMYVIYRKSCENVYIWMPETAKLSGNCTYDVAWSCRKTWRHKQTKCMRDDVTLALSREWKISCLLSSCVSTIVDLLSLFAAYNVRIENPSFVSMWCMDIPCEDPNLVSGTYYLYL
jgi:hypothetical protein